MPDLALMLFAKFDVIYGEKWSRIYGSDRAKMQLGLDTWRKYLFGLTTEKLHKIFLICETEFKWPPSIAEFLELIDRVNGAPTWQQALQLAIRKDYQHPAVELARKKVGSFAMQNDNSRDLEPKFRAAYEEALRETRNDKLLNNLSVDQSENVNRTSKRYGEIKNLGSILGDIKRNQPSADIGSDQVQKV